MSSEHSGPKKRVKVCCFCERWGSGGIESFLFSILSRIDLKGLQIDLVAAILGESIFTQPLQTLGVRFIELSGSQKKLLQNHRQFIQLLHQEQYDLVHLNIFHGLSLYYAALAKSAGVPVRIAHSHNTALRKSLTRPLKQAIHMIAKARYTKAATDLWACSKSAAEFLFSRSVLEMRGYRFIPNGIDIRRFRFDLAARKTLRKELGLENRFVIGNIGRLCYQKNQTFLLEVFAEILKRNSNSCLLLVGEGEDKPVLLQKVQQLDITEKVIFYGVTPHVEQLLWVMDVFVLPSRFEGLPVTSIEAQAAGLPCLFSDAVTRECQIGKRVYSLSLGAPPERWAEAIMRMDTGGSRVESAADVCAAGFDAANVSREIEDFYMKAGTHG